MRPRRVSGIPLSGDYEPSPAQWVRDQVALYERTAGAEGNTLFDTGLPVVIVTTREQDGKAPQDAAHAGGARR